MTEQTNKCNKVSHAATECDSHQEGKGESLKVGGKDRKRVAMEVMFELSPE